jgi:hypothetical protein
MYYTVRFRLFLYLALFLLTGMVFAEEYCAVVSYAQGNAVSVYRGTQQASFQLANASIQGMPLFPGDILETASGSQLEIHIYPENIRILLDANTSLQLFPPQSESSQSEESQNEYSQHHLDLMYGRIFIRNEEGSLPLVFSSGPAVARALSGVTGAEYLVSRNAPSGYAVVLKLFAFTGSLEIPGEGLSGLGADDMPLVLADYRQLSAGVRGMNSAQGDVLSVSNTEEALVEYWKQRQFQADYVSPDEALASYSLLDYVDFLKNDPTQLPSTRLPVLDYDPAIAAVGDFGSIQREVQFQAAEQRLFTPNTTLQKVGIGTFIAGAVIEVMGISAFLFGDLLLSSAIPDESSRSGFSLGLLVSGGVLLGGGVASFLVGTVW